MKKILFVAVLFASFGAIETTELQAQAPELDKSPMDMSYYPARAAFRNFEQMKGQDGVGEPVARITYSRPMKNDRVVFGELVKMDELWRLGANESTELMVYSAMSLGGVAVEPGRYSLYAMPSADSWTLVVSSQLDSWGAYAYSDAADVAKAMSSAVNTLEKPVEALSIYFTNEGQLKIAWDTTEAVFDVE